MTVAERGVLEWRIERLEDALVEYMDAVDKLTFSVEGDMRRDFLRAHAVALAALPSERWPGVRRAAQRAADARMLGQEYGDA